MINKLNLVKTFIGGKERKSLEGSKTVGFNAILIRGNLKNRPAAKERENQKKPRGCF